ncbi:uncharacterized protein LOC141903086 isoform X2 [Tubulanus polymorphus]|uniref:uncharacterized protein LOC141903086 isoform X2 n=1 Tax=Tubulanus polymorphus TaxID=672921 RepID=UPI003DA5A79F
MDIEVPRLSSMTVVQLKNLCNSHGIPNSGKKVDIIDRLTRHELQLKQQKDEDVVEESDIPMKTAETEADKSTVDAEVKVEPVDGSVKPDAESVNTETEPVVPKSESTNGEPAVVKDEAMDTTELPATANDEKKADDDDVDDDKILDEPDEIKADQTAEETHVEENTEVKADDNATDPATIVEKNKTPVKLTLEERIAQRLQGKLTELKTKHNTEEITDALLKDYLTDVIKTVSCEKPDKEKTETEKPDDVEKPSAEITDSEKTDAEKTDAEKPTEESEVKEVGEMICKLCRFKSDLNEKEKMETHCAEEDHQTKYEAYKKKCLENNCLYRVYNECEVCCKDVPYINFVAHEGRVKHLLNKMLTENGVAPMKLDKAQIQDEYEAINTPENPLPGARWVVELIKGNDMESFSLTYICKACNKDKNMSPEDMVAHIQTGEHKINILKKISMKGFRAVEAMVNAYNKSRPSGTSPLKLSEETVNFFKKNPDKFYRSEKISSLVYAGGKESLEMHHKGDEDERDMETGMKKRKSEDNKDRRGLKKNKRDSGRRGRDQNNASGSPSKSSVAVKDEDVVAKIQTLVNEDTSDIIGIQYLIERQFPNGKVEYHCSTCRNDLGTDQTATIKHYSGFQHKKNYLKRNKNVEFKKIAELDRTLREGGKTKDEIQQEIEKKTHELCEEYLTTDRPKIKVDQQNSFRGNRERNSGNQQAAGGRRLPQKRGHQDSGRRDGGGGGGGGSASQAKRPRDNQRRNNNNNNNRNDGRRDRRNERTAGNRGGNWGNTNRWVASRGQTGYGRAMGDFNNSQYDTMQNWRGFGGNTAMGGSGGYNVHGNQFQMQQQQQQQQSWQQQQQHQSSGKLMNMVNAMTNNMDEDEAAMILQISSAVSQTVLQGKRRGEAPLDIQSQVQTALAGQNQWGNNSGYSGNQGAFYGGNNRGQQVQQHQQQNMRSGYNNQQIAPPSNNCWNFDSYK